LILSTGKQKLIDRFTLQSPRQAGLFVILHFLFLICYLIYSFYFPISFSSVHVAFLSPESCQNENDRWRLKIGNRK